MGIVFRITLVAGTAALLAVLAWGGGEGGRAAPVRGDLRRVVSLSPSVTRQMVDLGAEDLLAGVTSYHPPLKGKVELVSSIVQPNLEKIFSLGPDAVFLVKGDVIAVHEPRISAMRLAVHRFAKSENFEDICAGYLELGRLLGRERLAAEKIQSYRRELAGIPRARGVRCAFFISHNPLVAAGGKSFINAVIRDAGGENVFGGLDIAYPIVSLETLAAQDPAVIISMMPGAEQFFAGALEELPGLAALGKGRVRSVGDGHLPYYTPRDYLESVRAVAEILITSGESR
jgi:ABC-type Fe3+-hydroxamate transport system substrate-binding protein